MPELQTRLEKLFLRLDHMGMRVEQALADALEALENEDPAAGQAVDQRDTLIDREEVQIEQECVRLLALYQPAAIDLRTICTIIKVNSDLERIADLAAGIGRRVKHVAAEDLALMDVAEFQRLAHNARDLLARTVRMLSTRDTQTAWAVIRFDNTIDQDYKRFVQSVLDSESQRVGGTETAITMINLAKALERVGDHCTNIAEDIIFLTTGDIVRHAEATGNNPPPDQDGSPTAD